MDVLGDPVVDLAVELEPHHVLGVSLGGAVYFGQPVGIWIDSLALARIDVGDNLDRYQLLQIGFV